MRIEAAADRGMALARSGGKVVFVPFAAPGDVLEVEILRERRNYLEAEIRRVLEPSPSRRHPRCPHFGVCGGCQWQHLPYEDQVALKDQNFQGLLRNRVGLGAELFRPPIPSPVEWGYRNRVSWKVRAGAADVALGYFAARTHRIVPIETCPIAHGAIRELLEPLRTLLRDLGPAASLVPQVDLQADGDERVWAVFHVLRPLDAKRRDALLAFAEGRCLAGALLQQGRKHTLAFLGPSPAPATGVPLRLRAGHRDLAVSVSPAGFVQANAAVNQSLVDELVALSPLFAGQAALDVYCGAGNFTLPLALHAAEVVGIEGYPPAAADGEQNALRNGLSNVRTLAAPAARGLQTLQAKGFQPAFAVLDPPREGALDALEPLAALGPEWVLYISCAPATLARDLGLLAGLGYRVSWSRIADMFPQTAHVESLTLLHHAGFSHDPQSKFSRSWGEAGPAPLDALPGTGRPRTGHGRPGCAGARTIAAESCSKR